MDDAGYCSIVSYEYLINYFGEWKLFKGQVEMIKIQNEWKIFFKLSMKASLSRFQEEIDDFYQRKERDKPENFSPKDNLKKLP